MNDLAQKRYGSLLCRVCCIALNLWCQVGARKREDRVEVRVGPAEKRVAEGEECFRRIPKTLDVTERTS